MNCSTTGIRITSNSENYLLVRRIWKYKKRERHVKIAWIFQEKIKSAKKSSSVFFCPIFFQSVQKYLCFSGSKIRLLSFFFLSPSYPSVIWLVMKSGIQPTISTSTIMSCSLFLQTISCCSPILNSPTPELLLMTKVRVLWCQETSTRHSFDLWPKIINLDLKFQGLKG